MSRSATYLRSLTSLNVNGMINYYKLGQIAGYIEGLEAAVALVREIDDNCGRDMRRALPPHVRAKIEAASVEPEI